MALWQKSAVDLSAGLRSKQFSATEIIESTLARIAEANPGLNALVEIFPEQALAQAQQVDQKVARGQELKPLDGIPTSIKVNVDVEGMSNNNGIPALKDNIAPGDSPVVANLKKAGAVIIGRTNTPEFSMRGTTDNPLYGLTKSPWDDRASPGGSSGGAGSACAAGFGPVHHGNDI
ncbi:MAG: amidase, partial [Gammaproteobacteria bacterium]|nr:amidase [Gammaproteobacteria bacterium]